MAPSKYDVAVAYRIYPGVSKAPIVFAGDKLSLARVSLESFKRALGTLKAKIWVLLDDCPPEFELLFTRLFDAEDLQLVRYSGIGNLPSFNEQIDILSSQTDAPLVYFAEDDYFYLPGALAEAVNFLRAHKDAHFVSLYDHSDYYALKLHQHAHSIRFSGKTHWRTAAGTCLTFLTTRESLIQTQAVFRTYSRKNHDFSVWAALTKQGRGLYNPFLYWGELDFLKIMVKTWVFGWRQIVFGKRWKLWIPIPSLATHLESTCLAPGVDWAALIGRAARS